jgi:hypothetical protein
MVFCNNDIYMSDWYYLKIIIFRITNFIYCNIIILNFLKYGFCKNKTKGGRSRVWTWHLPSSQRNQNHWAMSRLLSRVHFGAFWTIQKHACRTPIWCATYSISVAHLWGMRHAYVWLRGKMPALAPFLSHACIFPGRTLARSAAPSPSSPDDDGRAPLLPRQWQPPPLFSLEPPPLFFPDDNSHAPLLPRRWRPRPSSSRSRADLRRRPCLWVLLCSRPCSALICATALLRTPSHVLRDAR